MYNSFKNLYYHKNNRYWPLSIDYRPVRLTTCRTLYLLDYRPGGITMDYFSKNIFDLEIDVELWKNNRINQKTSAV